MGDHTETIQMDYDPSIISYDSLLEIFWESHAPTYPSFSKQYMSALFYHDNEQKVIAEKSMKEKSISLGKDIYTKILPFREFTLAEDYHQKYYLRKIKNIKNLLRLESDLELVNSPVATKLNGFICGHGDYSYVESYINALNNIDEKTRETLINTMASAHQVKRSGKMKKCLV